MPKSWVSIHALLAECDSETVSAKMTRDSFNPRTPCGVRLPCGIKSLIVHGFQSTHSLRSATQGPPARAKRPTVSIHALLAECDTAKWALNLVPIVSIHALLAECDSRSASAGKTSHGFNPRTPCGVRPQDCPPHKLTRLFQSTHSLRSATQPTLYITTQQSKSYFAPTSLKRPSLHGYTF